MYIDAYWTVLEITNLLRQKCLLKLTNNDTTTLSLSPKLRKKEVNYYFLFILKYQEEVRNKTTTGSDIWDSSNLGAVPAVDDTVRD